MNEARYLYTKKMLDAEDNKKKRNEVSMHKRKVEEVK